MYVTVVKLQYKIIIIANYGIGCFYPKEAAKKKGEERQRFKDMLCKILVFSNFNLNCSDFSSHSNCFKITPCT